MLDDTFGWSHARGNEVVPSPWQATNRGAQRPPMPSGSRINELTCLARAGMNPANCRQPLASRLHRAEDLLSLTDATSIPESDTARRKKLIFAPGLGHDALARRRTVLLDPTTETPACDTEIERLDQPYG